MRKNTPKISIIIPAHNEEENIDLITRSIETVLKNKYTYEIIFIDDGSKDKTLNEIQKISKTNPKVKYISLSRNFGHQAALIAGLNFSSGEAVISMDCDNQHPAKLIPKMIKKWKEGNEVVYTVRKDQNTKFFKRITSGLFYLLINSLSNVHIDPGAADFRLLDRKVVNIIKNLDESVIFLRGLISWCGFKQYSIKYVPNVRASGQTKYSLKKMILFALDGITSFSIKPLRLSTFFGFILSFISAAYGIFALVAYITELQTISGWASVIISVLFLGGIQLIMLGIIGEYLGKMFIETKKRPIYVVNKSNL